VGVNAVCKRLSSSKKTHVVVSKLFSYSGIGIWMFQKSRKLRPWVILKLFHAKTPGSKAGHKVFLCVLITLRLCVKPKNLY